MRRGGALVLGGVVLAAAILFASRPLGVAGLGLVVAALVSRAWLALLRVPTDLRLSIEPVPASEGDDVTLRVTGRRASRTPLGAVTVTGTFERLGPFTCRLRAQGDTIAGEVALGRLPRGLFVCADPTIELRDPLGLEHTTRPLGAPLTAVVRPRLVELGGLFSDRTRMPGDSRRFLLRRSSGFDFHSVREYEQGESLRRVHWPTTARRGLLMVKELEDAPRESVTVILDCDPAGQAGEPPGSSFDTAVRVAGSLLQAHLARGRRALLATTGRDVAVAHAAPPEGELGAVLDVLAAVDADAPHELAWFLRNPPAHVANAGELVVVTAVLAPATASRLIDLAARRLVSVVWIDAPSFAGRPTRVDAGLLQLSAAGIPAAVVRSGDDLESALDDVRETSRARA
jgi:uncharacterized protein (DUF58 family)